MKLCQSGGTLGDLAKADTRQRAEQTARKIVLWSVDGDTNGREPDTKAVAEVVDIIAAEFEK